MCWDPEAQAVRFLGWTQSRRCVVGWKVISNQAPGGRTGKRRVQDSLWQSAFAHAGTRYLFQKGAKMIEILSDFSKWRLIGKDNKDGEMG